jgi:CBS domain-containing protein
MVLYARDIVETDFIVLDRKTTVLEAAIKMKERKHGYVIVGSSEKPEGIVTEWDVIAKVVAEKKDPSVTTLDEIMTKELVSVDADEGIARLSKIMAEKGIRRILVTEKGKVLGIVSARTVLAKLEDYVDKISYQISRLQAPWF